MKPGDKKTYNLTKLFLYILFGTITPIIFLMIINKNINVFNDIYLIFFIILGLIVAILFYIVELILNRFLK